MDCTQGQRHEKQAVKEALTRVGVAPRLWDGDWEGHIREAGERISCFSRAPSGLRSCVLNFRTRHTSGERLLDKACEVVGACHSAPPLAQCSSVLRLANDLRLCCAAPR